MDQQQLVALWAAMAGIWGHRWTTNFGNAPNEGPAGALWLLGLRGLTTAQLRRGIDECVASGEDWPPSLPAFRVACIGIPRLAAVREALRTVAPKEIEPFVVLVYRHLDTHRLRQAPADKADRLIEQAYELARDAVLRGEPLPVVPEKRIEAPRESERKPASEETIARAAAEFEALFPILSGGRNADDMGLPGYDSVSLALGAHRANELVERGIASDNYDPLAGMQP